MTRKFLQNPLTEAARQSEEHGNWMVATVDPRMSWPNQRQLVTFNGKEFVLFPDSSDADQTAAIALRSDRYGLSSEEARQEIMRFCSALSWTEGSGVSIIAWSGGNLPRPIGVRRGRIITDFLEVRDMPTPNTAQERAAIAFYREGISLDNPFYGFLSLFKVIGALLPKGKQREAWITDALERVDDYRAKERREELRSHSIDVSKYLWDECRNAVAHAERDPYVNPDEVDDHFRLSKDIPLLRNLAELAIEENTGLKRSHTLWREHLYELAGFKEFLSEEVIEKLKNSVPIPDGTTVQIPDSYTVVARRGAEVYAFENMKPEIAGQIEGGMVFDLVSDDSAVRFRTVLSFADERLVFDPVQGIGFTPDRGDQTLIRHELNVLRFQRCILSNGHLEVWDQESEVMLGRSEACIPVNCFVNMEYYDTEFATLEKLLNDDSEGL
ncbi:methylamine utilization protein MauJ [Halomonas sp. Mc5H-6]|uniref:methylamine utilization protein MauJ n=1 Tax=Halomonas sp. Mc5H-6 TaxID=2954500 RepID=UPI00209741BF|nr:methylamine utilization protein MauJ [Halomonas sp. Mc5H-6]MCO7247742.1 hypothetical protein [Halomonas sp. Mc5H-6]